MKIIITEMNVIKRNILKLFDFVVVVVVVLLELIIVKKEFDWTII